MRALITGISGFVGSHLAEYLLAQGDWEVAGTVYGKPDNIAHLGDRLQLYPAELSRLEVVRYIVEESRPDYIFHLAAQPIPSLSRQDPWFTLENNIRSQLNVLEVVAQLQLQVPGAGRRFERGVRAGQRGRPAGRRGNAAAPNLALRGQQDRTGLSWACNTG